MKFLLTILAGIVTLTCFMVMISLDPTFQRLNLPAVISLAILAGNIHAFLIYSEAKTYLQQKKKTPLDFSKI